MATIEADVIRVPVLPQTAVTGAQKSLEFAHSIVVSNQREFELAALELADVKARVKTLDDTRQSFVGDLNKTVKRINDFFRGPIDALKNAEGIIKGKLDDHHAKVEAARRVAEQEAAEAARRIREKAEAEAREARAKADAEERKKREESERQQRAADDAARLGREAREREEKARREGDAQAQAEARAEAERLERERRDAESAERRALEQANRAAAEGDRKAQDALANGAAAQTMAPAIPIAAKADGVSFVTRWRAEVTDIKGLCQAVIDGKLPTTCVTANMKELNRLATAWRQDMAFPGVKAVAERGVSSRG